MPNRKGDSDVRPPKLSELIQFARVRAGSIVIDVYPGDGDWTRLFSDVVDSRAGLQLRADRNRRLKADQVAACRLREGAGPENVEAVSANLVAMPEATDQRMSYGCTCSTRSLHRPDPEEGATAADFNRAVYERLKPVGLRHRRPRRRRAGTSHAQSLHRIELHPFARRWRRPLRTGRGKHHAREQGRFALDQVFDPSIKGETDRFAYRFVKP